MTKNFYQCGIQEWSYWYRSIVSKALESFKFKSFNVHSLAFSIQSPEASVQSPASRVQCPESRAQSPASRDQRPTLVSRVQEFRYSHLNVKLCTENYVLKTWSSNTEIFFKVFEKSKSRPIEKISILDLLDSLSFVRTKVPKWSKSYLVCCNNFSENLIWCLVLICVLCRFVVLIKQKKHRGKKAREKLESKNTILVSWSFLET